MKSIAEMLNLVRDGHITTPEAAAELVEYEAREYAELLGTTEEQERARITLAVRSASDRLNTGALREKIAQLFPTKQENA